MEDLEMKHALRRYVQAEEPPFSLTAHALISQARRRQRWRMCLGIGGGAAATALAIVSTFALVPLTGGPTLAAVCDVQLPLGPSDLRPWPLGVPSGLGTANPTSIATSIATADPTSIATANPTSMPTPEPATPDPGWPGSPLPTAPPLTVAPGSTPTGIPAPEPVPSGKRVARERVDELSCFLKRRVLEMRPGATFVRPPNGAPMDLIALDFGMEPNVPPVGYQATVWVVDGPLLCLISVAVWSHDYGPDPQFDRSPSQTVAVIRTASSTIRVLAENKALTDEQVWELVNAPELDLYR